VGAEEPDRQEPELRDTLAPAVAEIVRLAEEEARRRGQSRVDARHLAYGLTRHPAGQAAVARAGIDPLWWRDHIAFVEGVNAADRQGDGPAPGKTWRPLPDATPVVWHARVAHLLRLAADEARAAGRAVAEPADLLSALRLEEQAEPAGTLRHLGASGAQVRAAAGHPWPGGRPKPPTAPPQRPPRGQGGPLVLLGADRANPGHARALALARRRPGRALGAPVRLVVVQAALPVADPLQLPRVRRLYGADERDLEVVDAGLATAADARSPAVAERLLGADLIHVLGGNPERLYDATVGSPALEALARASAAGVVCAGASAGAAIWGLGWGSEWYTGDPARWEAVPLWAWLERIIVAPHFVPGGINEQRLRRCLAAIPNTVGLGIPNDGAAVIVPGRGGTEAEAVGEPLYVLDGPDSPATEHSVGARCVLPA
jgi:cyanophycinase-like exopeptidase